AKVNYIKGKIEFLSDIINLLSELVKFYPEHIKKEDKHFFIPVMNYLEKDEQDKMLQEFWDFDKTLIHEKYKRVVDDLS
ncbi:MAG: hypothetical protein ACFFC1_17570, partial [Promethearchaeota archaeon]